MDGWMDGRRVKWINGWIKGESKYDKTLMFGIWVKRIRKEFSVVFFQAFYKPEIISKSFFKQTLREL